MLGALGKKCSFCYPLSLSLCKTLYTVFYSERQACGISADVLDCRLGNLDNHIQQPALSEQKSRFRLTFQDVWKSNSIAADPRFSTDFQFCDDDQVFQPEI